MKSISCTLILCILLLSCNSNANETEIDTSKPSNVTITSEVIGVSSTTPDGDGTGSVNFIIKATNASHYKVLINNETITLTENTFNYTFTKNGTNTYTVIVSAYNANGFTSTSQVVKVYVHKELELVWQDEFDQDGAPNPSKWGYNIGNGDNGWGNGESQYYTDRLENASVENGVLKIFTKKEAYQGFNYTSARLLTANKFDFTYGRIDIRAKLPSGAGVWPAIWMLGSSIGTIGWPACGEIDIMEYSGNHPNKVQSALHTTASSGNTINYKAVAIANETTEFHIYSMLWTEESIVFLLDDVAYYTYNPSIKNEQTWPFKNKQFIILNTAMGGALGGAISPDFTMATFEIDYVRVYK